MLSTRTTRRVIESVLKLVLLMWMILFINSQSVLDMDDGRKIKPDRCHAPIQLLTAQCCILPPFFALDIARKCGGMYSVINNDESRNISYRTRHLMRGCDTWECILREYKLETEDGYFDIDGYFSHLDRWIELNPNFGQIMAKAKSTCREVIEPFLPIELCLFKRLHFCIRRTIDLECPVLKNSDLCNKQKAFYDECREFFMKK